LESVLAGLEIKIYIKYEKVRWVKKKGAVDKGSYEN
jgi:hypothetical protein